MKLRKKQCTLQHLGLYPKSPSFLAQISLPPHIKELPAPLMELNCHITEMQLKLGIRAVSRILHMEMHFDYMYYINLSPATINDALY